MRHAPLSLKRTVIRIVVIIIMTKIMHENDTLELMTKEILIILTLVMEYVNQGDGRERNREEIPIRVCDF